MEFFNERIGTGHEQLRDQVTCWQSDAFGEQTGIAVRGHSLPAGKPAALPMRSKAARPRAASMASGLPPAHVSMPARDAVARAAPTSDDWNGCVRAVATGDREAFAVLFRHFAPRVKGYLVRSGTQDCVADDLAQEAMIIVWRRAASFDPARGALSTWIFTVARNLRTDQHRRSAARGEFLNVELEEENQGAADERQYPNEVLLTVQRERLVRGALASLAAEQALLLQLFFFDERPQATIARELGIPLGTVKTRIRSAVARMRKLMQIK